MFRNKDTGRLLINIYFGMTLFCVTALPGWAETVKVSLLLGDHYSRTALGAVKDISEELRAEVVNTGSGRAFSFRVYPEKDMRKDDLTHLGTSDIVIVFIMGRHLIGTAEPELAEVVGRGGKVYGVGGSYSDEHRKLGILYDEDMNKYFTTGTRENLKNMILFTLGKEKLTSLVPGEPVKLPGTGIYEPRSKKVFGGYSDFRKTYLEGRPFGEEGGERTWVGLVFHKNNVETGQTKTVDAVIEALERRGFNVLPIFGSVMEGAATEEFFCAPPGGGVKAIVAMGWKIGVNPKAVSPFLQRINVPVIDAITLYNQSEEEWEKSFVGLDILERAWQVGNPEMAGIIQPTVVAAKKKVVDPETSLEYVEDKPITERVERLADRVRSWISLREKTNREKKIAIIYYNYPPGKQNVGAAYLNVLPESLYEIVKRLGGEGYTVMLPGNEEKHKPVTPERISSDVLLYGRNIGVWAPGELERLVKTGRPVLLPVETYKSWFAALPETFRAFVEKSWGPVEKNPIMMWHDKKGKAFIVLPVVDYGNIFLMPQPARGWEADPAKLYHDVTIAPHHQYVAFYLWLKKGLGADAIINVGTHGTHEWLPGKEVGFTAADSPEVLIQDMPSIYPYIVDDVGEGLQAKRRGMAVVVDYMTPPLDKAGLNGELKELMALMNDYRAAREKSPSLAGAKLEEINQRAGKMGILKDIAKKSIATKDDVEELEDYVVNISEKMTPFGLHTFGRAPGERSLSSTAEAIVSIDRNLTEAQREERIAQMKERITMGARQELDSLIAALSGEYVPAGQGNDPIRNPDSLPTGKNFYSFDPTRIPGSSTYNAGAGLARDLIDGYRKRNGVYPDKLTFNLWATETIRHEGIMESQIMYLMGVKPVWDDRGRVSGTEVIPRKELDRPRIDVTIVPSGLYRDLFPNLMDLLDKVVTVARDQEEEDNTVRKNTDRTKKLLLEKGISEEKAGRLATVRIFTEPPGAYGTNLEKVITQSNTWTSEKEVADVYFMRIGHLYGQGFWGSGEEEGQKELGRILLKNALSGSKIAIHSRSSSVFATLDTDDFFQYLGGTAMAIRAVDGKSPEVYVTNLSNPKKAVQETLDKTLGREMRSRYLNPSWIRAMMKEGYGGARFVDKVTEHLWGWQVTVPEAVDKAKWQEMYETYVLDKNGLDLKDAFRRAGNMYAYQSLVSRMLETVRKEYWKPDKKIVETLAVEYASAVKEVGLVCCDHTCNNPQLTAFTRGTLLSIPGMSSLASDFTDAHAMMKGSGMNGKTVADGKKTAGARSQNAGSAGTPGGPTGVASGSVEGFEIQETSVPSAGGGGSSAPIPYLFIIGFIVFVGLVVVGYRRRL